MTHLQSAATGGSASEPSQSLDNIVLVTPAINLPRAKVEVTIPALTMRSHWTDSTGL